MITTDNLTDELLEAYASGKWKSYERDNIGMARELLAHRRASQAAPALKICQFCHDYGASSCTCFDEAEMGAAKAAPAPKDTDREWLIALLTHDQGELLDAYGVGAEVRQCDPELHGFAVAQADAIFERLSQSSELAQIDAMLMDGQGDDDGPQILPDFEPGWSVTAKVEACLFLLEKRRDVVAARASLPAPAPSDALREAVDAAWNDAIEAVEALEPLGRRWISRDHIRALRRAAPTEGEA